MTARLALRFRRAVCVAVVAGIGVLAALVVSSLARFEATIERIRSARKLVVALLATPLWTSVVVVDRLAVRLAATAVEVGIRVVGSVAVFLALLLGPAEFDHLLHERCLGGELVPQLLRALSLVRSRGRGVDDGIRRNIGGG